MTKKYFVVDLNDDRVSNLANILSNKTARKIVEFLAEGEASESDISSKLNLPANTVNYNIKKLLDAGVIEKSKKFLWSEKGKKIYFYQVANRSIVISPKKLFSFKKIIPSFILVILGAFIVRLFEIKNYSSDKFLGDDLVASPLIMETSRDAVVQDISISFFGTGIWLWFLVGGLFAIILFALLDYYNRQ